MPTYEYSWRPWRVYVVHVPPADEHRAPPEPTHDQLSFWIPAKLNLGDGDAKDGAGFWEKVSNRRIRIAYRFVAENSAPIDGEWVVGTPADTDTTAPVGRFPDAKRIVPAPEPPDLDGGLLKRLGRRLGGRS